MWSSNPNNLGNRPMSSAVRRAPALSFESGKARHDASSDDLEHTFDDGASLLGIAAEVEVASRAFAAW
jgi:hypothetical protein